MSWKEIPDHTSIRFSDEERQIIAAILAENPHLQGKMARAISFALYQWKGGSMKTYNSYVRAKREANRTGKPIWKHDAGYYAVASYEDMASHCDQSGEADSWTEIS
jgi:hypothetical protein